MRRVDLGEDDDMAGWKRNLVHTGIAMGGAGGTMRGETAVDPQAACVGGGKAQRRATVRQIQHKTESRRDIHRAGGEVYPKRFH